MFESWGAVLLRPGRAGFDAGSDAATLDAAAVAGWIDALARPDRGAADAARIDQIAALERLKSAAAVAQAVLTADFAASQRAAQRAAGVPAGRVGRGIAAQIALARRDSPHRGGRHLGLARALVEELPATMAALQAGQISEWRATIVARETACLTRPDRSAADAELAGLPGGLGGLGDRQVEAEAKRIAYRLDPHAFMARLRGAEKDRRVTLRPAPDTMSRLSGFLPVAQGVAAHAALTRHADTLRAAGDPRSRGQIMADTLVERLTGQTAADAVPVEIQLIMTDTALLGRHPADAPAGHHNDESLAAQQSDDERRDNEQSDYERPDNDERFEDQTLDDQAVDGEAVGGGRDEPAHLVGFGPIPAPMARDWIRDAAAQVWVRRLYTQPDTGALIAMTSRRRRFPTPLRRFLVIRDQLCRSPWCGAPIREADHAVPVEAGGTTSVTNGQGLCQACNLDKQALGFTARPGPAGAGHTVTITTPTGHRYTSHPPPPPGAAPTGRQPGSRHPDGDTDRRRAHLRRQLALGDSALESQLRRWINAA